MTAKRRPGRQMLYRAPMVRVSVKLDAASVKAAKVLGSGNVSRGVRLALAVRGVR